METLSEDLSLTFTHSLQKTADSVQHSLLVREVETQKGSVTKTLQSRTWVYKMQGLPYVSAVKWGACNGAPILAIHMLFNSPRQPCWVERTHIAQDCV